MSGRESHVEIIVPIVCGFTFFFFLVMYFIWKVSITVLHLFIESWSERYSAIFS
jgi:hypothetical protein